MISVYAVDLSCMEPKTYDKLYAAASPERKARADKHTKTDAARCCVVAEALLRHCVKRHLALDKFRMERNEYGKPRLTDHHDFYFNISHSGHWVVLACGNTEVGIDVETIRMDDRKDNIARRFFTPEEQRFVQQEEGEKAWRFFQIWTAKESYLKYLGTGLQKPLNSFCVRSMEFPNFFSQQLGDCAMTLCTEQVRYQLEILQSEQLL